MTGIYEAITMIRDTDIANWAENAINKVESMLDVIMLRRRDERIRWDNLGITKEEDFLKGYLLSEIVFEFARQCSSVNKMSPSPPQYAEAYKVIMNRANDINKAIADTLERR